MIKRCVLLLVALLTGCSGPVTLTPPQPTGESANACSGLLAAVPEVVDGQSRREVRPTSPYTAAWGDPAITLACGVPKPGGLNAASECFEVNGVGWFSEDRPDYVRFTTIGRSTYVQVTVPMAYVPANPLVDLATPIDDHITVITECV